MLIMLSYIYIYIWSLIRSILPLVFINSLLNIYKQFSFIGLFVDTEWDVTQMLDYLYGLLKE